MRRLEVFVHFDVRPNVLQRHQQPREFTKLRLMGLFYDVVVAACLKVGEAKRFFTPVDKGAALKGAMVVMETI